MDSLIGDRFLKGFLKNRLHRRQANPACEVLILPENMVEMLEVKDLTTEKPAEPACTPSEYLPNKNMSQETTKTGQIIQPVVPVNGSDQMATE